MQSIATIELRLFFLLLLDICELSHMLLPAADTECALSVNKKFQVFGCHWIEMEKLSETNGVQFSHSI